MNTFWTKYLRPAVVLTLILTIVTGFLYPGVVTALAQLIFNHQANGSLLYNSKGQVIGSELIGQYWTLPQYFHGRPSATVNPTTGTPEPTPPTTRRPRTWGRPTPRSSRMCSSGLQIYGQNSKRRIFPCLQVPCLLIS